jgi:hypothetical protein
LGRVQSPAMCQLRRNNHVKELNNMEEAIEDLESAIAFESEKDLSGTWTEEYREGYVDGLKQSVATLKFWQNLGSKMEITHINGKPIK